jgi:hypothetical protein
MNMYQPTSETASPYPEGVTTLYDFQKDFGEISRRGMFRYLEHIGIAPEDGEDPNDLTLCPGAEQYLDRLRAALAEAQWFFEEDVPHPEIATWSRESAIALTEARLDDMLSATADEPVDIDRAVRLGAELARKPRDGKQGLDVGPEAAAYAADRLRSKIERDAVSNPVAEAHAGILDYHRRGGGKVVYLDMYKLWHERAEQAKQDARRQERADEPKQERAKPRKLMFIGGNELRDMPKKAPWFFVEGVVQGRKVNLLMGEDGSGKSFLMLLLGIIAATGNGDWLGFEVKHGPVMFLTAEEEVEEVWERIEAIERMLGRGPLNLKDFYLVAIDDESDESDDGLILGGPTGEKGKIQMTDLWRTLLRGVERIRPVCTMLDPLVEIFDGDEMIRLQSRQFMAPIRKAARKYDTAFYVSGHPSKTSAKDKSGTSGTTGWSATTRGRQFYEIVYDDDNNDTGERKFHVKKVTRGKAVPVIDIKLNEDGVPVLKDTPKVDAGDVKGGLSAGLAKMEQDRQRFMDAIEKKYAIGVFLSASPKSPKGYAPKALVDDEGGARGRDRLARIKAKKQIMDDLLDEGRIASRQYGPRSKDAWRLEVVSRTIPGVSEEENMDDCEEG